MFLALAAYGLALIVQLQTKTTKSLWSLLRLIRTYMDKTWDEFTKELFRKKSKTSKGRQKVPIPRTRDPVFRETVAMIKPQKKQ